MKPVVFSISILCLILPLQGVASEPPSWGGEFDFGYVNNSGNTESSTGNAKLTLLKDLEKWRYTYLMSATGESEDNDTTAEKYLFTGQVDYWLVENKTRYVFGKLKYEDDRFSGFDYQSTISTGLGWRLIDTEKHSLDVEGGVGFQKNEPEDGETDEGPIVTGTLRYTWALSESASLNHETNVEAGNNTIARSETSLNTKINHHLALRLAYNVKYTQDVPDDREQTDRQTVISLVYSF